MQFGTRCKSTSRYLLFVLRKLDYLNDSAGNQVMMLLGNLRL